jgi:hypothetical protein
MKKYQYPELIQNRLGGGSASADVKEKYRAGVIQYWVGMAFDDMIVRIFQNSVNPSQSDLDLYTKPFPITSINAADSTGKKYVTIPTTQKALLQIPNNKAIRHIWTIATTPVECLYRDMGMSSVYNMLEADDYLTNPRFEIMGKNIYFDDKIGTTTGVTVYMVVPYSEFDDMEDLPAPLENNSAIMDFVFEKMMNMKPEDKITDDNLVQV